MYNIHKHILTIILTLYAILLKFYRIRRDLIKKMHIIRSNNSKIRQSVFDTAHKKNNTNITCMKYDTSLSLSKEIPEYNVGLIKY